MKTPCPFTNLMQAEVTSQEEGTARLIMPFREELTNPVGYLHGGAIASLADAALAVAVKSLRSDPRFFTAEMKVRYRSPTRGENLVCDSKIESRRGEFLFGGAKVMEESGKVVAEVQATFLAPDGD